MVGKTGVVGDPVGDLLARLRNAVLGKKREITAPYSRLREGIGKVLLKEGYLREVKREKGNLRFSLVYQKRRPRVSGVKNISRPGVRVYRKVKDIKEPLGGAGITIVSTSKGIMSSREAKKKGLGGEILGEVW